MYMQVGVKCDVCRQLKTLFTRKWETCGRKEFLFSYNSLECYISVTF